MGANPERSMIGANRGSRAMILEAIWRGLVTESAYDGRHTGHFQKVALFFSPYPVSCWIFLKVRGERAGSNGGNSGRDQRRR